MSEKIWTALHPLGWWRNVEMKFYYDKSSYLFGSSRGRNWAEDQCRWYLLELEFFFCIHIFYNKILKGGINTENMIDIGWMTWRFVH